jgi:hypothetical protein
MLLNLTNRYYVNARDHYLGGILCESRAGPSFGNDELRTRQPLLGKDNVRSFVNDEGFKIGGKVGEINPLTGDIIARHEGGNPHSRSTAIEIEVWQIETEAEYA